MCIIPAGSIRLTSFETSSKAVHLKCTSMFAVFTLNRITSLRVRNKVEREHFVWVSKSVKFLTVVFYPIYPENSLNTHIHLLLRGKAFLSSGGVSRIRLLNPKTVKHNRIISYKPYCWTIRFFHQENGKKKKLSLKLSANESVSTTLGLGPNNFFIHKIPLKNITTL